MVLAPLPPTLSPSRIGTFTDCPRMFQYQAIERLESPPNRWTFKGTLVHSALEALFCASREERTVHVALAALHDAGRTEQALEVLDRLAREDRVDPAAYLAECESLVRHYFELEDPRDVDAVGVELRLEAPLGHGPDAVSLRGIIDRLDRTAQGDLVVVDYKTGRAPSPGRERSKLAAVETYALLCERVLGTRPVAVRLLHLKEPVVIERRVGEAEVRRQERRAQSVWVAIERAHAAGSFRPSPGPLCRYCFFADRCEGAALAR